MVVRHNRLPGCLTCCYGWQAEPLLFLSPSAATVVRCDLRGPPPVMHTQFIHNCELPGIAGQATAPAFMPGFCQETWPREEPLDHHVLTPLPGRQRLPLLAPESPEPAQVAGAVDRFLALREFRSKLYACLTSRADAQFELTDAILCADHAVTSLVQLSLAPQFRRGHGALYDALAAGQIDEEAFARCSRARCRSSSMTALPVPGSPDTTRSITGCWTRPWPRCRPGQRRRCGTRARGGRGCGSPSTPPPIPGPMPSAHPAAGTSIMTRAAATAPARPSPAGSTSSSRRSGTCAPPGPRWSMSSGPRPRPAPARPRRQVKNLLRRLHAAGTGRPRRAAGHLRRRVQRRRADRRPGRTRCSPSHPPGQRQRVLRRPRHLARQDRPSRQARHDRHLPQRPRQGEPRAR